MTRALITKDMATTLIGYAVVVLVIIGVLFAIVSDVSPQIVIRPGPICGPYKIVAEQLLGRYDEAPSATGTIGLKSHMEFWRSKAHSWTFVEVFADGTACIVKSGNNYEETPWQPGRGASLTDNSLP